VLRGRDVGDVRLSDDLRSALHEWTEVAETVLRSGDDREVDLLRRRGRQLASRVADTLGRPVDFVDPVSGVVESIRVGATTRAPTRATTRAPAGAASPAPTPGSTPPESPDPTPWGTGTAVAVFFAVLVALADIVLARAFAGAFGLLWLPANLLVTAGTTPSLWLAREVPFWRWPALGAAAGIAVAWIVMLLGLLGS
jgi:hypothetical protein